MKRKKRKVGRESRHTHTSICIRTSWFTQHKLRRRVIPRGTSLERSAVSSFAGRLTLLPPPSFLPLRLCTTTHPPALLTFLPASCVLPALAACLLPGWLVPPAFFYFLIPSDIRHDFLPPKPNLPLSKKSTRRYGGQPAKKAEHASALAAARAWRATCARCLRLLPGWMQRLPACRVPASAPHSLPCPCCSPLIPGRHSRGCLDPSFRWVRPLPTISRGCPRLRRTTCALRSGAASKLTKSTQTSMRCSSQSTRTRCCRSTGRRCWRRTTSTDKSRRDHTFLASPPRPTAASSTRARSLSSSLVSRARARLRRRSASCSSWRTRRRR